MEAIIHWRFCPADQVRFESLLQVVHHICTHNTPASAARRTHWRALLGDHECYWSAHAGDALLLPFDSVPTPTQPSSWLHINEQRISSIFWYLDIDIECVQKKRDQNVLPRCMQRGLSVRKLSVWPSVRLYGWLSNAWFVTKRKKFCPDLYTIRKII